MSTRSYPSLHNCTAVKAVNNRLTTYLCACAAEQKFICPGGLPKSAFDPTNPSALSADELTIKACADGMWTQEPGSWTTTQCSKLSSSRVSCQHGAWSMLR
jgi:hypothetical protein